MDFAARVRTPDGGERQVLIEIQKTNAPTVVERFRAYLGQQLCSPANIIEHPSGRREAAPVDGVVAGELSELPGQPALLLRLVLTTSAAATNRTR